MPNVRWVWWHAVPYAVDIIIYNDECEGIQNAESLAIVLASGASILSGPAAPIVSTIGGALAAATFWQFKYANKKGGNRGVVARFMLLPQLSIFPYFSPLHEIYPDLV